jgi:hypothetical protein
MEPVKYCGEDRGELPRSGRGLSGKVDQMACKPGSVPVLANGRRSFLWTAPCGTVLATNPGASDRRRSCRKYPSEDGLIRRSAPIRSCSRRGLPCRTCHQARGGLLPHPFTLTLAEAKAVCFLWRYPWGHPRRALPAALSPWSPDFPRRLRAATARPSDPRGGMGVCPSPVKRKPA